MNKRERHKIFNRLRVGGNIYIVSNKSQSPDILEIRKYKIKHKYHYREIINRCNDKCHLIIENYDTKFELHKNYIYAFSSEKDAKKYVKKAHKNSIKNIKKDIKALGERLEKLNMYKS